MAYPPLPEGSADELERSLLARWKEEDLFRATLAANREGRPFVFYEGPPTANGRPGIHHVFARTIKDLVCRFHAMQGQSVTRIAGWDTHGLPVEIEVEKELQLNGKKAIEAFGDRLHRHFGRVTLSYQLRLRRTQPLHAAIERCQAIVHGIRRQ